MPSTQGTKWRKDLTRTTCFKVLMIGDILNASRDVHNLHRYAPALWCLLGIQVYPRVFHLSHRLKTLFMILSGFAATGIWWIPRHKQRWLTKNGFWQKQDRRAKVNRAQTGQEVASGRACFHPTPVRGDVKSLMRGRERERKEKSRVPTTCLRKSHVCFLQWSKTERNIRITHRG